MGMFEQLGQQKQVNPQQQIPQIQSDPVGFLKQKGFNIPSGMNDPRQITSYLLQTGQVGNQRMQMAQQVLQRMMGRR